MLHAFGPPCLSTNVLRNMATELKWGLLALGRCGQTQVDVDTSCGPERLLALEISTPVWSLRFCIPESTRVQALASFLQGDSEQSIIAGSFGDMPVEVRRDHEQGDRLFIDRKSTRLNSSHGYISYAVFC